MSPSHPKLLAWKLQARHVEEKDEKVSSFVWSLWQKQVDEEAEKDSYGRNRCRYTMRWMHIPSRSFHFFVAEKPLSDILGFAKPLSGNASRNLLIFLFIPDGPNRSKSQQKNLSMIGGSLGVHRDTICKKFRRKTKCKP